MSITTRHFASSPERCVSQRISTGKRIQSHIAATICSRSPTTQTFKTLLPDIMKAIKN